MKRLSYFILIFVLAILVIPALAGAQGKEAPNLKVMADTVWVLITATLVFFMNAGFATVESGLCRAKNAVNILSKNVIVFCVTSLAFWAIGFAFMFGEGNLFIGFKGLFLFWADNSPPPGERFKGNFFFFH